MVILFSYLKTFSIFVKKNIFHLINLNEKNMGLRLVRRESNTAPIGHAIGQPN